MKITLFQIVGLLAVAGLAALLWACSRQTASSPQAADATLTVKDPNMKTEKAAFAAGCFWGVEETFRQTPGVVNTTVGYMGGHTSNPTYEDVCTEQTGHAETVLVEYDPARVSYDQLLDVFWKNHNPTTKNRQGPDFGSQYRSVIFYYTPQQQAAAQASMQKLQDSGKYTKPIVTEIVAATDFWKAEEYHQRYLEKHGLAACHVPEP